MLKLWYTDINQTAKRVAKTYSWVKKKASCRITQSYIDFFSYTDFKLKWHICMWLYILLKREREKDVKDVINCKLLIMVNHKKGDEGREK